MNIETKFDFFEEVYLKSDPEQKPRLIVSFQVMPGGIIKYELESANTSSWHFQETMSREKIDFNIKAGFRTT